MLDEVKKLGTFNDSIVLSDVSGSMGDKGGVPMQVSIALGLLISAATSPPFQNLVISFHTDPTFHEIKGDTLLDKVKSIKDMSWGGSTDIQKVFDLIVTQALANSIPNSNMPKRLFILSDMQFNEAAGLRPKDDNENTNYEACLQTFTRAGYDVPQVIFWNLRPEPGPGMPVQNDTAGTVMLNGFSTSALKEVINGSPISTPWVSY